MALTRRSFLELLGASTAWAVTYSCAPRDGGLGEPSPAASDGDIGPADPSIVNYTDWLFIHPDGSVTAHTGRVELGQGLTSVLSNILSQALEIDPETVHLVMGDTDSCPDDGPTSGSAATRLVGWGYWRACDRLRDHLVQRAADLLSVPVDQLLYRDGAVVGRWRQDLRVAIGDLADGAVHLPMADAGVPGPSPNRYTDLGTLNVNGEAIVTGTQVYTGDLFPGSVAYASWLLPDYHVQLTRLESADLDAAGRQPGVVHAERFSNTAMVVGDSYSAVARGCSAAQPTWKTPRRSRQLDVEAEIRAGAELRRVIEANGDPDRELADSPVAVAETYITQYASQVPIETETAVADVDGGRVTVWASTQAPFRARGRVAARLGIPEDTVRVINMPVGGGFGVKVGTQAPEIAAEIARAARRRVKLVYSRDQQFRSRARYKEAVVADIATGVTRDGRLLARTLDLYQDEGHGSTETYDIPAVRTRLFATTMPARHGVMRGTSFVQTGFAVESHTDVVADEVGLDPLVFRKKNVHFSAFIPLLDACAERIGYGVRVLPEDHGVGVAICVHGGRQLGAVAAEVAVDRSTGVVSVVRLDGAFDVGLVINRNTLTANTKGAMLFGLGYALFEEVRLDGYQAFVRGLGDYRIPRFSDLPAIEISFHDNLVDQPMPRGCGELPVIPTLAAIANAVRRAVGLRFHTLPITPERVLAGLRDPKAVSRQA